MSGSRAVERFNEISGASERPTKRDRKAPPPLSIRLTHAERERLRRDAGSSPPDLSDEQKAQIYCQASVRHKGREPKNNPYIVDSKRG